MSFQRSALRSVLSRRTPMLAPRMPARNFSQAHPLRSSSKGNYYHKEHTPDTPWIIGSIAVTLPACYYLMSSSPSEPHHARPHLMVDTVTSSPGMGQHRELITAASSHSGEATPKGKEGASSDDKQTSSGSTEAISKATEDVKDQAKEAAGEFGDKASELYGDTKAKAEESVGGTTEKAKDAADKATNKASETVSSDNKSEESNKSKTSEDPTKTDPGYTSSKEAKSTNEMSGKQEGVSNADTENPVLHTERGDAISKKPEGVHQAAKIKGTVDTSR